jgi:hypothetical protein
VAHQTNPLTTQDGSQQSDLGDGVSVGGLVRRDRFGAPATAYFWHLLEGRSNGYGVALGYKKESIAHSFNTQTYQELHFTLTLYHNTLQKFYWDPSVVFKSFLVAFVFALLWSCSCVVWLVLALVCVLSPLSCAVIHIVTLILVYGCKRLQFVEIPYERDKSDTRTMVALKFDLWITWEGLSATLVRRDTTTWNRQAFEAWPNHKKNHCVLHAHLFVNFPPLPYFSKIHL